MKDKLTTGGEVFKGLIKTSGEVADKMLDKGSDVATDMMKHTSILISKLADDIGIMADRILTMEERIGLMADRIVKTEELMAQLTSTLANKKTDHSVDSVNTPGDATMVTLSVSTTNAYFDHGPALTISGAPRHYILFVSTDPLFQDGRTVATQILDENDYQRAWQRSLDALRAQSNDSRGGETESLVVSIAVRTISEKNQISGLSNSVDVTVKGG